MDKKFEINQPKRRFEVNESKKKTFIVEGEATEVMKSLFNVGSNKPMGYLPIRALENYSNQTEEQLVNELTSRGLKIRFFDPGDGCLFGPSLYVYDQQALQKLLDNNRDILKKIDWPTEATDFVEKVATYPAEPNTPLYDLVAKAFADTRIQ